MFWSAVLEDNLICFTVQSLPYLCALYDLCPLAFGAQERNCRHGFSMFLYVSLFSTWMLPSVACNMIVLCYEMSSNRMLIDSSYVAATSSDNCLQLWVHWVRCRYGGCMRNKAPSSQNICFWQKRPPTAAAMVSVCQRGQSFAQFWNARNEELASQNIVLACSGSFVQHATNRLDRQGESPPWWQLGYWFCLSDLGCRRDGESW